MDLIELLVAVETDLWNRVERDLLDRGEVGLGTLLALRAVHRRGGAGRVHELRSDLFITVGAASKLVDRLEHAELVVRRPHPDDGRSSLIALTAAGDDARATAEAAADAAVTRLLGRGPDVAGAAAALRGLGQLLATTGAEVPA